MKEITLKELQTAIAAIDHKNHAADQYFYKLAEEVGELAKAIRKGRRLESCGGIKGTVEEELYDVLYYTVCLANILEIDLTACAALKEKLNAEKYGRKCIFEV